MSEHERVLILGANGMLGHALMDVFARGHEVIGVDLPALDITNEDSTRAYIAAERPAVVVNAAARTDVDGCEGDPGAAFAVNAGGAGNVACACAAAGARLVHVSTDYVFDGIKGRPYVEGDRTNPQSVYGKSKLAGEESVQAFHDDHVIVRTSWLFGAHGRNFVDTILRAASTRKELDVVGDQRGCPTYAPDLAEAIERLAGTEHRGVVHVANSGLCSWFEYARAILELSGVRGVAVREITSDRLDRPAPRPPCSALDCGRYASLAGAPMRHWRDAVMEYLRVRSEFSAL
ncbi:MAG: dTDP-4-dehydrorhamnose reductase [Chlamydiota bacterium]